MGFKQLVQITLQNDLIQNGITFHNNRNGSWRVYGTATANVSSPEFYTVSANRKAKVYFMCGCPPGGSSSTYYLSGQYIWYGSKTDYGNGVIINDNGGLNYVDYIKFNVKAGVTLDVVVWPQVIDLTDLYGAGLEPTTVAEFRSRYPNPYYAPNNGYMRLRLGARALLSELTWNYNSTYDYYYTNSLTSNSPDYNRLKVPSSSSEKIAAYIPGFTAVSYDDRNKDVGPRVYYDPGYSLVTIRGITSIPTNTYIDYATNVLEYAVINNKKKGELTYNGVTYVFDNTRPTKMAQLNVYGPSSSAPYFVDSTDNALTLPVSGQTEAHIDIQSYLGCPSQYVPSAQRPFTINGEVISTGIPPWSNKITFTNEAATWVDTTSTSHSIPPMQTGEYRYVVTQYFDPL